MAAENASGGLVVTSGQFIADAIAFAERRNIILVDGPILHDMVARTKPAPASNARRNPLLANDAVRKWLASNAEARWSGAPRSKAPMRGACFRFKGSNIRVRQVGDFQEMQCT